jgi:2-C-methyl-D-erythritol 4-phosphate cytidylyltransferase
MAAYATKNNNHHSPIGNSGDEALATAKIVALIFAGGSGKRMASKSLPEIPKQFLEYDNKSIIIYTLEHFQQHSELDAIIVVCLSSWIEHLQSLIHAHNISKVIGIVAGAETGQASICNGLMYASQHFTNDSLIMVHDGVRPLIDEKTITENIACARQYGNAITTAPATETIVVQNNSNNAIDILNRDVCSMARAPQTFLLGDLMAAHRTSLEMNADGKKIEFIDSASMMYSFGYKLHFITGQAENIKITTPSDYYTFCALQQSRRDETFG